MAHAAAAHLEPRSRPPLTWRLSTALALAVIESFDDMGLKEDLLRGIYSYGFEKPSAIQQRAIKPLILMRDTIAQAQSGTGKTATFTIGARHLRPTAHAQQPQQPRPHQACPAYASLPRPVE